MRVGRFSAQGFGGKIEQTIRVLQSVFGEPAGIIFVEQREVEQLVLQLPPDFFGLRERAQFGGRELVLLQFRKQRAQFRREARTPRAAAKQF